MIGTQRPWLLVLPLSVLGTLGGHWLAYRATGTPTGPYHEYLVHLPRVTLVLLLLAFVGACFVERRARVALWPFPAVAVSGFVVQEHAERLEHSGSVPFLLTSRVFLAGLALQLAVAVLAWLVARLLIAAAPRHTLPARRRIAGWLSPVAPGGTALVAMAAARGVRSRAPPRGR